MAAPVEKVKIGGIIKKPNLALLGVLCAPDRLELMGTVFEALGERGVNCVLIVQSVDADGLGSIFFALARPRLPVALEVLSQTQGEIGPCELVVHDEVGIISVFGPHFGERAGIAGRMFAALGAGGIEIHATSTSISSLSCVVDGHRLEEAVGALMQAFQLPGS
jgi:aspartate kinase